MTSLRQRISQPRDVHTWRRWGGGGEQGQTAIGKDRETEGDRERYLRKPTGQKAPQNHKPKRQKTKRTATHLVNISKLLTFYNPSQTTASTPEFPCLHLRCQEKRENIRLACYSRVGCGTTSFQPLSTCLLWAVSWVSLLPSYLLLLREPRIIWGQGNWGATGCQSFHVRSYPGSRLREVLLHFFLGSLCCLFPFAHP